MKRDATIMVESKTKRKISGERHIGPNLLLLTVTYLGLLIAGGSRLTAAVAIPHDSVEKAVTYMATYGWTIQLGSFFELLSAIPLGIFIATTMSRLRFLGIRSPGEPIALLGGVGATTLLVLSALTNWSLTRPGIPEEAGAAAALRAISFAAAGPGFAVLLGFFIAGVSLAAGLHKSMPRWLMAFGIVIGMACELAAFTVLNFKAGYFIPVGRFGSIVWMIGVALTLPMTITDSTGNSDSHASA
ncbi:MAG TPA: hypothetical protein VGG85_03045 [Terracidiphilus sp.]|jgi:hypothetical protein